MSFVIGRNCKIHPSAFINVEEGSIGDGAVINENVRIEGRKIIIGRESFIDRGASIGGGSCFDPQAELVAGDWLHMGVNSHINIACGVSIGHEFGCGIETKIFTHGAYSDSYNLGAPTQWAPVKIGDQVWCPNAWINPGVTIGSHVVVSARSLINKDLPTGCLAGGVPVKILKENYLPQKIDKAKVIDLILKQTQNRLQDKKIISDSDQIHFNYETDTLTVVSEKLTTTFNLSKKTISGTEIQISNILKDQLRRNGLRFRFEISETQTWKKWL